MTIFHQVSVTLAFGTKHTEDELWALLDKLGHHSPAAQIHRAAGWLEQGLENEEDADAGQYSAAEIVVGTEAVDEEDLFNAGRRLTSEVLELFPQASFERVELLSMNLGDPENIAYV